MQPRIDNRPSHTSTRRSSWRILLTIAFYGFFAVALLAVGKFLLDNREAITDISRVPLQNWILPFIFYLLTVLGKGLSFDILAIVYGIRIRLFDSIALTTSALVSNYALPGNAGIALRTLYMDRVHKLSYRTFLPLALTAFVFGSGLYGVAAGLFGLMFAATPLRGVPLVLLWTMVFGGLAIMLVLAGYHLWGPRLRYINKYVNMVFEGWSLLLRQKKRFAIWLTNEIVRAAFEILFFYSVLLNLDLNVSFSGAATMMLVKENLIFLRLTPGAFGVTEGVFAMFAIGYGLDPAKVVFASLICRVIELASLGALVLIFVRRVAKKLIG